MKMFSGSDGYPDKAPLTDVQILKYKDREIMELESDVLLYDSFIQFHELEGKFKEYIQGPFSSKI